MKRIVLQERLDSWNTKIGKYYSQAQIDDLVSFLTTVKNGNSILKRYDEYLKVNLIKLVDLKNIYNLFLKHNVVNKKKDANIIDRLLSRDKDIANNALFEGKLGEYLITNGIQIKSEPCVNNNFLEFEVKMNPRSYIEIKSPKRSLYAKSSSFRKCLEKQIVKEIGKNLKISVNLLRWTDEKFLTSKLMDKIRYIKKTNLYGTDIKESDNFIVKVDSIGNLESRTLTRWYKPYLDHGLISLSSSLNDILLDIGYPPLQVNLDNLFTEIRKQIRSCVKAVTLILYIEIAPSEKTNIVEYLDKKINLRKDVSSHIKDIVLASPAYDDNGFHFNFHRHFINNKCQIAISNVFEEALEKLPKAIY